MMPGLTEEMIAELYDVGIAACNRGDRTRLRAVLAELISALNFEHGGELVHRLAAVYEFCQNESVLGDLTIIIEILEGLRQPRSEHFPGTTPAGGQSVS
jgi:flagellar secretion chaperone FliS